MNVLLVTEEPFLIYSANLFAILGLRALYVVLAGAIADLRYLRFGLAAVLAFAGGKLLTSQWLKIPPLVSVAVIAVMIGTAVTVDAVDQHGRFLGGLILPGFGLMLRALEMGTAGLKAPTGEAVDFPTNTSDALMSGGTDAIAGAIERMHRKLQRRTGMAPRLIMSGGAAVKIAPIVTELQVEMVETLIFDGLLQLQSHRLAL